MPSTPEQRRQAAPDTPDPRDAAVRRRRGAARIAPTAPTPETVLTGADANCAQSYEKLHSAQEPRSRLSSAASSTRPTTALPAHQCRVANLPRDGTGGGPRAARGAGFVEDGAHLVWGGS